MRSTSCRAGTAMSLAAATLAATSAAADETGPPVAIAPLEWGSEDTTSILVYGQIDKGVLSFDDGENSTSYGLTDNANSSTRAGVTSRTRLSDEWELFSNIEIQYAPHSSGTVNQLDPNAADYGFDNGDIRKIEAALFSDRYGRFWIGQGSMASDGVAEVDLSGTGVIAYSSVGDTAGGSLFAFRGGGLSDVTVGDVFDNFDGLGRKVRVRYDTPDFSGFRLRTSYGRNLLADDDAGLYDVAVTYDGAFGAFLVAAAAGYARDEGNGADILSGSVSGLHEPTGHQPDIRGGRAGLVRVRSELRLFEARMADVVLRFRLHVVLGRLLHRRFDRRGRVLERELGRRGGAGDRFLAFRDLADPSRLRLRRRRRRFQGRPGAVRGPEDQVLIARGAGWGKPAS